jgi:hypothetical protein
LPLNCKPWANNTQLYVLTSTQGRTKKATKNI